MAKKSKERFIRLSREESNALTEQHTKLNNKLLRDAKRLLGEEDYVQASEKYWGAAAQVIKAVAAKRGLKIMRHRSISEFVYKLHRELPDQGFWELYRAASELHTNFYEEHLPPDGVVENAKAVEEMIDKLKVLLY
jgi:HEPN domain-containing protein